MKPRIPRKGAPRKQPRTIRALRDIGEWHAYKIEERRKDRTTKIGEQKFLPDIIAEPLWGNRWRALEVEATVTNNTIYKSLTSLLQFLSHHPNGEGFLVVPSRSRAFANNCLQNMARIIRAFTKKTRGKPRKIRLRVITFDEVEKAERALMTWLKTGKRGRPPKCSFLPRLR